MAATYSRVGNTVTFTVTVDVTDLAAPTMAATDKDKITATVGRAMTQLQAMIDAQQSAQTTAQITALQAKLAALPKPVAAF